MLRLLCGPSAIHRGRQRDELLPQQSGMIGVFGLGQAQRELPNSRLMWLDEFTRRLLESETGGGGSGDNFAAVALGAVSCLPYPPNADLVSARKEAARWLTLRFPVRPSPAEQILLGQ